MKEPSVTIVVLNFNGINDTRKCILSLLKSDYPKYKILIIDNGSLQNEAKILKREFQDKKISIKRFNKNLGFAGGNNKAVKLAKTKYVLLLNQDATISGNTLTELVKSAEKENYVAAFQPKILFSENHKYFEYAGAAGGFIDTLGYPFARGRILFHLEEDKGQYDDSAYLDWACGSALFVRKIYLKKVGGLFDADFFAYQEEIDFSMRIKRSGLKVKFVPKAKVYHRGVVTESARLNRKIFWTHRNNLFMLLKNFSSKRLLWLLPLRISLDFGSMIFYLLSLRPDFLIAVIKAQASFVFTLPKTLSKRRKLEKKFPMYADEVIYGRGSIVFKYFIQGKRKFSQLEDRNFFEKHASFGTSHSLYYGDLFKYKKGKEKLNKFFTFSKSLFKEVSKII